MFGMDKKRKVANLSDKKYWWRVNKMDLVRDCRVELLVLHGNYVIPMKLFSKRKFFMFFNIESKKISIAQNSFSAKSNCTFSTLFLIFLAAFFVFILSNLIILHSVVAMHLGVFGSYVIIFLFFHKFNYCSWSF